MKSLGAMIYAKDLEAMTAFYRDVMALSVVKETSDWVELDAGGTRLALHAIPIAIASGITITTPPEPRTTTPIKLLFVSDDVQAFAARLRAAGGTLSAPRLDDTGVIQRIDGFDPEGNVFGVSAAG